MKKKPIEIWLAKKIVYIGIPDLFFLFKWQTYLNIEVEVFSTLC